MEKIAQIRDRLKNVPVYTLSIKDVPSQDSFTLLTEDESDIKMAPQTCELDSLPPYIMENEIRWVLPIYKNS